jgi:hypothetical protein
MSVAKSEDRLAIHEAGRAPAATALRSIGIVVAMLCAGTSSALAQWASEGVRLDMFGSAQPSAVCSDGQGGAVAVWPGPGGTGPPNIYSQSVTSQGYVRWASGGIHLTPALGLQQNPVIAPDGSAGAFIAWQERRYNFKSLYAQHILANGLIAPGWPDTGLLVSTRDDHLDNLGPAVVSDGAGGIYCSWYESGQGQTTHNWIVFMQRINADATRPAGWIDGGNIVAFGPGDGGQPSIVGDGNHGVLVTWTDFILESSTSNIYLQKIDLNGATPWGSPRNASAGVVSKKAWPRIVADGSGGAVVGWYDVRSAYPGAGMYVQRLTSSGTIASGWDPGGYYLSIAPDPNGPSAMVPDGAGGAIVAVAWSNQIRASRVSGDLSTIWLGSTLSASSPQKEPPRAVGDGFGGAIVVWEDVGLGLKTVHAQRVTSAGGISPGWPVNGTNNITNDYDGVGSLAQPAVTEGGPGQAIVVYPSTGGSTRMLKIGADGATVSVTPSPARAPALALVGFTPNPIARDPTISFSLPNADPAALEVFDLSGRRLWRQEVGARGAGHHTISLGRELQLPAGVYYVRLSHGGDTRVARGVTTR